MSDFSDHEVSTHLRSGMKIYASQDRAIERALSELYERCPAQFLMVTDSSGLLISVHGDRGKIDLIGLGSLIAGDLAASKEIARFTDQYQSYQMVLREGQNSLTVITEAGHYLVLFAQVSSNVPMGWARLLIRETARRLAEIVESPPEDAEHIDLGIEDNLTDLFDSALDNLWNG